MKGTKMSEASVASVTPYILVRTVTGKECKHYESEEAFESVIDVINNWVGDVSEMLLIFNEPRAFYPFTSIESVSMGEDVTYTIEQTSVEDMFDGVDRDFADDLYFTSNAEREHLRRVSHWQEYDPASDPDEVIVRNMKQIHRRIAQAVSDNHQAVANYLFDQYGRLQEFLAMKGS